MKKYIVDYYLAIFNKMWPDEYYLADFLLTHIINHPKFYYNYNRPDFFSINGKGGFMISFIEFINLVANTSEKLEFNGDFTIIVTDLVRRGAPLVLFKEIYQTCCPK